MTDEVKTRNERVEQGENLAAFAERHGTDPKTVVQLNEVRLREHAAARGFDHTFPRTTQSEDGKLTTDVDYHVFAGEELKVPDQGNNKSSKKATNEQQLS